MKMQFIDGTNTKLTIFSYNINLVVLQHYMDESSAVNRRVSIQQFGAEYEVILQTQLCGHKCITLHPTV